MEIKDPQLEELRKLTNEVIMNIGDKLMKIKDIQLEELRKATNETIMKIKQQVKETN